MEHKVSGNDQFLFLGTDGITYNMVICLTSQTFGRTTNIIDAKTKCGPDKQPGTQDNTYTFEGQSMYDPTFPKISIDDLDDLQHNITTVYWKSGKLLPGLGDITYFGTGFIAEITETYAQDTPSTFSGSIGIYGGYSKSTATS